MASKRPQTFAKRQRELAVKERRDLKRAKKAARRTPDPGMTEGEADRNAGTTEAR